MLVVELVAGLADVARGSHVVGAMLMLKTPHTGFNFVVYSLFCCTADGETEHIKSISTRIKKCGVRVNEGLFTDLS